MDSHHLLGSVTPLLSQAHKMFTDEDMKDSVMHAPTIRGSKYADPAAGTAE